LNDFGLDVDGAYEDVEELSHDGVEGVETTVGAEDADTAGVDADTNDDAYAEGLGAEGVDAGVEGADADADASAEDAAAAAENAGTEVEGPDGEAGVEAEDLDAEAEADEDEDAEAEVLGSKNAGEESAGDVNDSLAYGHDSSAHTRSGAGMHILHFLRALWLIPSYICRESYRQFSPGSNSSNP
jgi:hypothetical protein